MWGPALADQCGSACAAVLLLLLPAGIVFTACQQQQQPLAAYPTLPSQPNTAWGEQLDKSTANGRFEVLLKALGDNLGTSMVLHVYLQDLLSHICWSDTFSEISIPSWP